MAEIKLEGMSFFAHHGYYAHEQIRGGNYLVDVSMEADIDGVGAYTWLYKYDPSSCWNFV